jgi:hypothetical protein
MRMRGVVAVAAVVFVWGHVSPAAAQNKSGNQQWVRPKAPDAVDELREFQQMSPEERQRELAKLPPARRARVEQQMERLDKATPEQRERIYYRLETMQRLTPERRQAVNAEIESLRGLTQREKRARMDSEDFNRDFSPEEQKVIRDTFPDAAYAENQAAKREMQARHAEAMQRLSPDRRRAVNEEIRAIRMLATPQERRALLFSAAFENAFSPEEQALIREEFPVAKQGPPKE